MKRNFADGGTAFSWASLLITRKLEHLTRFLALGSLHEFSKGGKMTGLGKRAVVKGAEKAVEIRKLRRIPQAWGGRVNVEKRRGRRNISMESYRPEFITGEAWNDDTVIRHHFISSIRGGPTMTKMTHARFESATDKKVESRLFPYHPQGGRSKKASALKVKKCLSGGGASKK